MSKKIRENEIMKILKGQGHTTVAALAKQLHISPSSIRRDLTTMENKGYVKRTHGGVTLVSEEFGMIPFPYRLHEYKHEKRSIAHAAASLLKKGSSVFLDGSTISFRMHPHIDTRLNLTVFTNNVYLAQILSMKNVETYCVGGQMSERSSVITTGRFALEMLNSIYVDQMFFSTSALSRDGIITDIDEAETDVRRLMMSHAEEIVLLHQDERFGTTSKFLAGTLSEIDYLITDSEFSNEFKAKFPKLKIICT